MILCARLLLLLFRDTIIYIWTIFETKPIESWTIYIQQAMLSKMVYDSMGFVFSWKVKANGSLAQFPEESAFWDRLKICVLRSWSVLWCWTLVRSQVLERVAQTWHYRCQKRERVVNLGWDNAKGVCMDAAETLISRDILRPDEIFYSM